jgi:hydrogenase-4 component F
VLALNHSLAKSALFLTCGNIIQACGTKNLTQIRGLLSSSPPWAVVMVLASVAVTGTPPFGAFLAEWQLLSKISEFHLWPLLAALIFGLTVSFLAIMSYVGKIVFGSPKERIGTWNNFTSSAVPAALVLIALLAGITNFTNFIW